MLDPGLVKDIKRCIDKVEEAIKVQRARSEILWSLLEPLVDQHDPALDEEIEKLLAVGCYAKFEVRVRIRHLRKLKGEQHARQT
jgi:hypothetical protein